MLGKHYWRPDSFEWTLLEELCYKVLRTFPVSCEHRNISVKSHIQYMHVSDGAYEWETSLCNVVIPVWNLSFLKPQFPELIIPVVSYSNGWPLCMFCCNWSMHNQTSCGHFYNASDYKDKLWRMTSATRLSIHESTSISHRSSDS